MPTRVARLPNDAPMLPARVPVAVAARAASRAAVVADIANSDQGETPSVSTRDRLDIDGKGDRPASTSPDASFPIVRLESKSSAKALGVSGTARSTSTRVGDSICIVRTRSEEHTSELQS